MTLIEKLKLAITEESALYSPRTTLAIETMREAITALESAVAVEGVDTVSTYSPTTGEHGVAHVLRKPDEL